MALQRTTDGISGSHSYSREAAEPFAIRTLRETFQSYPAKEQEEIRESVRRQLREETRHAEFSARLSSGKRVCMGSVWNQGGGSMSFQELRLQLASVRDQLRHAKDTLTQTQAEAEQHAIYAASGQIGKNEAERTRALTLALNRDPHYRGALTAVRCYEAEIDRLEALLEGAKDARRIDEWAIRARLAEALLTAGIPSDQLDTNGDSAFDDTVDRLLDLKTLPF